MKVIIWIANVCSMNSIDLNFENCYNLTPCSADLTKFIYNTELTDGSVQEIIVEIQPAINPFLDEFLNLAFGPPGIDGKIDDFAAVKHLNSSKAFSTVLLSGLAYLQHNPKVYIGVDGSDFRRAYLYYRTLQRNFDYLTEYFRLFGVKYFARILRGKDKFDKLNVDIDELTSIPYTINRGPLTNHKSLYNYFIFYLNL